MHSIYVYDYNNIPNVCYMRFLYVTTYTMLCPFRFDSLGVYRNKYGSKSLPTYYFKRDVYRVL